MAANDSVVFACLYTKTGSVLAHYQHPDVKHEILPPDCQGEELYFDNNYFKLFSQVEHDGETIGTVYIQVDTWKKRTQLIKEAGFLCLIILLTLAVAYFLTGKLQKLISGPILALTRTTQNVSDKHDYSIRHTEHRHDEVGTLIDSFNNMLQQIQDREAALAESKNKLALLNKELEQRVVERTKELEKINCNLKKEVVDRVKAELAVRNEKDFAERLVETAQVIILMLDIEGRIVRFNKYMKEISGYELKEVQGKDWFSTFLPECHHRRTKELFLNAINDIQTRGNVNTIITKSGEERDIEWHDKTLKDADGKIIGLLAIGQDITIRKQAEDNLKKAKEELENINKQLETSIRCANQMAQEATVANQAKSEFLANMSHEIRTPMNSIIGFSDILSQEVLTDGQMDYVQTIRDSGKNLLTIIDDILDFSKIEAGKLDTEIIECSLEKLLGNISSMLRPKATEKGLDFKVLHKTELPANIRTDPTRVYQCLTNLINNAIKFTENGHVHVIVSLEEIENKPIIRFDIEDTGIGIPANKQKAIFESFSQVDGSTTRKFGGTGLGLTITKHLAGILGGSVTVQSEPGKGSVFSLSIPAGLAVESQPVLGEAKMKEYTQESPETAQEKYSGNILVAEDNPSNQKLIEILLKRMGLQISLVEDGQRAVDATASQSFDLIFMDMQMPVMNGYEATEALRQEGLTTPIVALTANAMKKDKQKCLDAGCDGYLAKPVDREKLSEILSKYLDSDSFGNTRQEVGHMPHELSQIDNSPIVSELADDPDLREVAEVFVQNLPSQLQTIAEAVDHADLDQLKYLIHTIKGAGGSAGFPVIMEAAAKSEQIVLKGELDSLKAAVDELTQLCQRATADKKASSST